MGDRAAWLERCVLNAGLRRAYGAGVGTGADAVRRAVHPRSGAQFLGGWRQIFEQSLAERFASRP
jgi:hypothetical protein